MTTARRGRILDPLDRITEILFGVIMVLTFTGAIGVATAERVEVREMLAAALGCNIAWGIIDGGMYLMSRLQERGRTRQTLRAVRSADELMGRQAVEGALPPLLVRRLSRDQIDAVRIALGQGPEPDYPRLTRTDLVGAFEVFLLVFLSTVPIAIPFLVVSDLKLALRLSNGVAVLILFVCGYHFGRLAGLRPWATGLWMVVIGGVLVGLTIALGG